MDTTLIIILSICITIVAILVFAKWFYIEHYTTNSNDSNMSKSKKDKKNKKDKKDKKDKKKKRRKHDNQSKSENDINLLVIFSHSAQSVNVKYNKQISQELKSALKENFIDPMLRKKIFDKTNKPQIGTSEEHFKFDFDNISYATHIIYELHE